MHLFEVVENLFEQYGYLVLLIGMPLELIALPIPPGNTTLTYTGFLAYKGVMAPVAAFSCAVIGVIIGFTVTYILGYLLGMPLIERFGKWLFLKPTFIEKTQDYYNKYGNRLLFIGLFIPGVRQFIGYFVGMIRVPYRTVLIYGYTGALTWVVFFFGIGYIFGEQWQYIMHLVEVYLKVVLIVASCLIIALLIRSRVLKSKQKKKSEPA